MATPATQMSKAVTTALYIGGKERQTTATMAIADPAKPGLVVGYAASATPQDVTDAVAAAKAAYPAWSSLTPQQRAEKMLAAIEGVPDSPNPFASEDGAILSQENGKIRLEGWIDALVLQIRWKLALMHADEIDSAKVLKPVPGHIPTETTVRYQPLGRGLDHRAVQLAHRHPGRRAAACVAGRQHRDREAGADGAAGHRARRSSALPRSCARRAQCGHGSGCQHEGADPELGCCQGLLHRLGGRREEDDGAGLGHISRVDTLDWVATMLPSS